MEYSLRSAGSYQLTFAGAKEAGDIRGLDRLPGLSNHLIGGDSLRWQLNVPQFARVESLSVYAGIDVSFHGDGGLLECDFHLAPHADPRQIRMRLDGARQIHLTPDGDLAFLVGWAGLEYRRPRAFQERGGMRVPVEVLYRLQSNGLTGFSLGRYDHNLPLVIDPVLTYRASFGGSSDQSGRGVAVDSSGNVYVVGYTASPDFPTHNPFQAHNGSPFAPYGTPYDVFVTKLNPSGGIVYSTYLGGSGDDMGAAIAVDSGGNAYVTGRTSSSDFPLVSPLQASYSGTAKAFVAKLNADGNALAYSTYLGGSSSELGNAITVDPDGNAYVAGYTSSADFPTTKNAFLSSAQGMGDVFVSKLDPAGVSLVFSTYLGGHDHDQVNAIALDVSRNVYLTGETYSTDFPLLNAVQPTPGTAGRKAAFVSKFAATGQTLLYSTYLGDGASGAGIVADTAGNAYVTGSTDYSFPLLNPIQGTSTRGSCFVTKLTAAGTIAFSTGYGGGDTSCTGIALDSVGRVIVVGGTGPNLNLPLVDPIQTFQTANDLAPQSGFVAMFDNPATKILFSSILGLGSEAGQVDVNALVADTSANVYTAGEVFPLQVVVNRINLTSACSCTVWPLTYPTPIPAGGGSGAINVTAPRGCKWNAIGMGIAGGNLSSGNGTVTFQLPSGMGPDQTFNLVVAGQKVTVTQSGYGCPYQIFGSNPTTIPGAGGSGQFVVSTGAGCPSVATTTDGWITIGSQLISSVSGGVITFTVAANTTGQTRQGTISAGGLAFTITQDSVPVFGLTLRAVPPGTGSIVASPLSPSGTYAVGTKVCLTATPDPGWLFGSWTGVTLDSSNCLTMNANVSVTANFTAAPSCLYYLDGTTVGFGDAGGLGRVRVTLNQQGCSWSVSSDSVWITITSATSFNGSGAVLYTVADYSYTTGTRTGHLSIAGQTFTITQVAGCHFTIDIPSVSVPWQGQQGTIQLTASNSSCPWTSYSDQNWAQQYPQSGTGSATVSYTVYPTANTGGKTANIYLADKDFQVYEDLNPAVEDNRFVDLMYFGFLGRAPSPTELSTKLNALQQGTITRTDLAVSLFNSTEFNNNGRFIAGAYVGILGRDAEYTGWLFQRSAMNSGIINQMQLLTNMSNSAEYQLKYGTPANDVFVNTLYNNLLRRDPTSTELANQLALLQSGTSRAQLAYNLLTGTEFQQDSGPRLTAFLQYACLLLRDAEQWERDYWANLMATNAMTVNQVFYDFVNSAEMGIELH
ncbi:MAG: SBBP repeat-containing protein [Bryobacteraceae bacterium]